ncbi:MAG TPA: hypothetical protein VKD72_00275, partial [Gemmataceae bacterium]|nr:hypothetical protein [Gemmataceae bacterium]
MRTFVLPLLLLLPIPFALAQEKKKDGPKNDPKVILAQPFGLPPGKTTKLALRGLKLDGVKEVKVAPKGSVKLLKKGKVAVPQMMEADRVGDTQVEVEVTLPADANADVELTVVNADGKTAVRKMFLDKKPPVAEKEPNDGFKQAQAVKLGQTI